MIDILYNENIKLRSYSEGSYKTKCSACQPPHDAKDNPLSVTIQSDHAVWNCHHCGRTGTTMRCKTNNFVSRPKKVFIAPKTPDNPKKPETLYSWFSNRGISKETVEKKDIYIDQEVWIALPYKDENKATVNIKYRSKSKKFKQTPNAKRTLYNYDLAYDQDTIIFVEGEMDVLSLLEVGYENAVSLPDGAPKEAKFNEKDARFTALENCPLKAKKVILFTDNDEAGQALHAELLHRFGKDMCWFVEYPSDCKDANEVLVKHGPMRLKNMIETAKPYPVDGLYSANEYYGSVIDLYNGNYAKPVEIGYDELDKIYKVLRGTFHVITGIPNHGKSSWLDQILLKLSKEHNWRYAVYSPEHSTAMHLRRLVQMHLQKSFDEGFSNRMSRDELQAALDWLNERFYFIETPDSVPDIDYILDVAKSSVLKYGCDGLVIDPYNEVSASRDASKREDEHIRDFISKCKRFARVHDIVVWIVAHPTKQQKNNKGEFDPVTAYDISGASHWNNQSDCILSIHRMFEDDSIQVLTRKIREQGLYGQIGEARFYYNASKRVFEERGEPTFSYKDIYKD